MLDAGLVGWRIFGPSTVGNRKRTEIMLESIQKWSGVGTLVIAVMAVISWGTGLLARVAEGELAPWVVLIGGLSLLTLITVLVLLASTFWLNSELNRRMYARSEEIAADRQRLDVLERRIRRLADLPDGVDFPADY